MEPASIAEIKKRINELSPKALKEVCLRLIKYKKENKELISYLLFYAGSEETYIQEIKTEMESAFEEINQGSLHWAKKSVRKILRNTNKHCKYSGNKQTEVELLFHFCKLMKQHIKGFTRNPTLLNIYQRQIIKIQKDIQGLHEDLQYDYNEMLAEIIEA